VHQVGDQPRLLKDMLPDGHVGDSVKTQTFAFTRWHNQGTTCFQRCFRSSLFEDTEKVSLWNIMFRSEQWPTSKSFLI